MKKIDCDLEYIRSPIGFPTDLATSVPLVLMAAKENLDSVAFGTVLESAYRLDMKHVEITSKAVITRFGGSFRGCWNTIIPPVAWNK